MKLLILNIIITTIILSINDLFPTIEEARGTINHYILIKESLIKFINQIVIIILLSIKNLLTNLEFEPLYLRRKALLLYSFLILIALLITIRISNLLLYSFLKTTTTPLLSIIEP